MRYTARQRSEALRRIANGETVLRVSRDTGITTATLQRWSNRQPQRPASLAVLRAVREGATNLEEVQRATRLPEHRALAAAFSLRGDGEKPKYLCCADGDPWAITEDGLQLLKEKL